jgi:hypothetical protein
VKRRHPDKGLEASWRVTLAEAVGMGVVLIITALITALMLSV